MAVDRELLALQQQRRMQDQAARRQAILQAVAAQQAQRGQQSRGLSLSPMRAAAAQRQAAAPRSKEQNPFDVAFQQAKQQGLFRGGDTGGGGGGIGGALANIGKGALSALDIGRRGAILGIESLADVLPEPLEYLNPLAPALLMVDEDREDDRSWMEKLGDAEYGAGQVFRKTGNKWLDRTVGFVGDVALDPLTYVTFGTSKFAGSAGRAALAGEAIAHNAAEKVAGRAARFGDEALERIAKVGEHGLDAAEREALGLDKAGMRFGIKSANIRLPGTGRIAEGGGKTLSALRGTLTDTPIGRGARRLGGSREKLTREFAESFVTGRGPVTREQAASTLRAVSEKAAGNNGTLKKFANRVRKDSTEYAGRSELFHAVEAGEKIPGTERLEAVTQLLYNHQIGEGVALKERQRYMPHYGLEPMEELMGRAGTDPDLLVPGMGSGSGRLNPRVFEPGKTVTIAGKPVTFESATAQDITSKLWEAFPELHGTKLIEDDPGVILPRLLKDAARDVGNARFDKALKAAGIAVDEQNPLARIAGKLDESATAAARKAAADDLGLGEQLTDLGARREQLAGEFGENVADIQGRAADDVDLAGQAAEAAEANMGRAGRGAEFLRSEMERIATQGAESIEGVERRVGLLNDQITQLTEAARAARREGNQERLGGYLQRLQDVSAERQALVETYVKGRVAKGEQDAIRKRLYRAKAKQVDLQAQVGEGPLGAERVAAGQTLPQRAEREYLGGARRAQADAGQAMADVEELSALRGSKEAVAELATEQAGRPIRSRTQLNRAKTALGGTPEGFEAKVRTAGGTGLTKKRSHALTKADRIVARRNWKKMEKLAEPDVISDEVVALNEPHMVQSFYDTQGAMQEALRPYRTANAEGGGYETLAAQISPEDQARRLNLQGDLNELDAKIRAAKARADAGIETASWERTLRSFRQERRKLTDELDSITTTALPRQVEAMGDMTLNELTDRAARQAEVMVRYANMAKVGGKTTDQKIIEARYSRALREALETERTAVEQRLAYRLPAEWKTADTETVARFADDEALEAEVKRRWGAEATQRSADDERVLKEGIDQERKAKTTYGEEEAKPKRAQAAVKAAEEDSKKARVALTNARKRLDNARRSGRDVAPYRKAVEDAKQAYKDRAEALESRIADLGSAESQWKLFKRKVGTAKAPDVVAPTRETEEAFKTRVRDSLRGSKEQVRRHDSTFQTASAFELESTIEMLAEPARRAYANLKRFQRLVEQGKLNPGTMGELLEERDIAALLERGESTINAVEGQLRTRVAEERQALMEHINKLSGKPLWKRGLRYAKGSRNKLAIGQMLEDMSPAALDRWGKFLKGQSVMDNRRLRDLDDRLARLGKGTGGAEVTDVWTNVLEAPMRGLGDELPARDLSKLTDPQPFQDIADERTILGGAEGALDRQLIEAKRAIEPPMDAAVDLRRQFEEKLAGIAPQNTAARAGVSRDVGELAAKQEELARIAGQGREAGEQLRATTPDEQMSQRLQRDLAPIEERQAGIASNLEQTEQARVLAQERLDALPGQVAKDFSATRAAYEAARGAEITGAVDVAATQQAVEQATASLKSVNAVKVGQGSPAGDYQNAVDQLRAAIDGGAPDDVISILDSSAKIAAELVDVDEQVATINMVQKRLASDKAYEVFETALAPGWAGFYSKSLGENLAIPAELNRALENMNNILFKEPGKLGQLVDKYTRFFKMYATATPGFHLRNSLSASFMNAADDVSFVNMLRGMKAWKAFLDDSENPNWWMKLPANWREAARDGLESVFASGAGGAFDVAEIGACALGPESRMHKLLLDNIWTRTSQRWGGNVEGSVRLGMAIDTMVGGGARGRAGGSIAEATQRINRVHFNYSQVSEMDEMARRVVPFWTFLSRNVPLQMQQMLTKPRTYLTYASFVRNFEDPMGSDDLPKYMQMANAFRITPGVALMPDVGANQLATAANQLTSPSQLLSLTTPAIKTPLQLTTNRQFFYDEEYKDNDYQKIPPELRALQPFFDALKLTEQVPGGGGPAVERKWLDAAYDMAPPLSLINALLGTTPNREGKEGQARLNKLGIPVRMLTPDVMAGARRSERFDKDQRAADRKAKMEALAKLARTG